jgi:hypothetical protein
MKINRDSARALRSSAKRMIAKCKAFVLITIDKENNLSTTREIRGLQHFPAEDPLRVEFLKMCDNLQGGSIIVNGKHKKYLDVKDQARRAEEFKAARSEELGVGAVV